MSKFILFTKENCPGCIQLKTVLKKNNIETLEFTVEAERGTCEALGVTKYPTLMWYENGEKGRMEGYSPRGLVSFMEGVEDRS